MRNIFLLISVLAVLLMSGCATKKVEVEPTIVFPPYPAEPKILYLETYRGGISKEEDTGLSGLVDGLLGEGSNGPSASKIIKPYGVGLSNGKVYVADPPSNAVFVIDKKTREVDFLGTGMVGRLSNPISLAFDANKTVYVSDARQKAIHGYNKEGKHVFALGGRLEFTHPTGIAVDKKLNRLYVVDTKAHHIKVYDIKTKEHLFTIGKRGNVDGEFNYPTNVAIDGRNSNIVVCDTQNFRIQIFDKDGHFIRRFGKVGDRPGTFARPKGVAVDTEGHIYVTDSAFNNIQIFNDKGELLLWFGSAGYGKTQFRLITGIYINEDDEIVIADAFSGRVQTFQYLSEKWKKEHPAKYKELTTFQSEVEIGEEVK